MVAPIEQQIARMNATLEQIAKRDVAQAHATAINNTTKQLRTEVVRRTAQDEKVPANQVRRKTFLSRARPTDLRATLTVYARDIPLISLMPTGRIQQSLGRGTNRKGVTARGRTFPGAFINPVLGGRSVQVLQRKGSARYPIEVIKIPIAKTVRRHARALSEKYLRSDYPRLLKQELAFRLSKYVG